MSRKSFPFFAAGGDLRDLSWPGYCGGNSTMAQKGSWDQTARSVVSERLEKVPTVRFFSEHETALLGAGIDRLMPQDDRSELIRAHTSPILAIIDAQKARERSPWSPRRDRH